MKKVFRILGEIVVGLGILGIVLGAVWISNRSTASKDPRVLRKIDTLYAIAQYVEPGYIAIVDTHRYKKNMEAVDSLERYVMRRNHLTTKEFTVLKVYRMDTVK